MTVRIAPYQTSTTAVGFSSSGRFVSHANQWDHSHLPCGWKRGDVFCFCDESGIQHVLLPWNSPKFCPYYQGAQPKKMLEERTEYRRSKEESILHLFVTFSSGILWSIVGLGRSMEENQDNYPVHKSACIANGNEDDIDVMIGTTLMTHARVLKTTVLGMARTFSSKFLRLVLEMEKDTLTPHLLSDSNREYIPRSQQTRKRNPEIQKKQLCLLLQNKSLFQPMLAVIGNGKLLRFNCYCSAIFVLTPTTVLEKYIRIVEDLCDDYLSDTDWDSPGVGTFSAKFFDDIRESAVALAKEAEEAIDKIVGLSGRYGKTDTEKASIETYRKQFSSLKMYISFENKYFGATIA